MPTFEELVLALSPLYPDSNDLLASVNCLLGGPKAHPVNDEVIPDVIRAVVLRLDEVRPGWDKGIDLNRLYMRDIRNCILGQLYGSWREGLNKIERGGEDFSNATASYQKDWEQLIQSRRNTNQGEIMFEVGDRVFYNGKDDQTSYPADTVTVTDNNHSGWNTAWHVEGDNVLVIFDTDGHPIVQEVKKDCLSPLV